MPGKQGGSTYGYGLCRSSSGTSSTARGSGTIRAGSRIAALCSTLGYGNAFVLPPAAAAPLAPRRDAPPDVDLGECTALLLLLAAGRAEESLAALGAEAAVAEAEESVLRRVWSSNCGGGPDIAPSCASSSMDDVGAPAPKERRRPACFREAVAEVEEGRPGLWGEEEEVRERPVRVDAKAWRAASNSASASCSEDRGGKGREGEERGSG